MIGEMVCAHCGRRVPIRFGAMPRRCACGAEFEWAPFGGAGRVAAALAALADGLRSLRAEGAHQVRRHAEAVRLRGGVRMGAVRRGGEGRRRPCGARAAHVAAFHPHVGREAASPGFDRPLRRRACPPPSTGCACARRCSCASACCAWRESMWRNRCGVPN